MSAGTQRNVNFGCNAMVRSPNLSQADTGAYTRSVFINCPFDAGYAPQLRAILFALIRLNYIPRCALESKYSGLRIHKVFDLIHQCRFGIHDLSMQGLDLDTSLPRFNMPFELGLFLGCTQFSTDPEQKTKVLLILDSDPLRFRASLSDIAGYDIGCHHASPQESIRVVRDWLADSDGATLYRTVPMQAEFCEFEACLPEIVENGGFAKDPHELTFADTCQIIRAWIDETFPANDPA